MNDIVRGNTAAQLKEASDGIDPDYRRIAAAVWRRRRILWSQARVLVMNPLLSRFCFARAWAMSDSRYGYSGIRASIESRACDPNLLNC
jgi:hypothetical protein